MDQGIWCNDCNEVKQDLCLPRGCNKHPLEVKRDRIIPSFARLTLPKQLVIKSLGLHPDVHGVFPRTVIQSRTLFGPVLGQKCVKLPLEDTGLPLKIFYENDDELSSEWLDLSDENYCNWMRFVRPASKNSDINLVAFQYKGDIYYVTTKAILRSSELRVWYAKCYAGLMGLSHDFGQSVVEETPQSVYSKDDYCDDVSPDDSDVSPDKTFSKRDYFEPLQFPLKSDKSYFICQQCEEVFAEKELLRNHLQICNKGNNKDVVSEDMPQWASGDYVHQEQDTEPEPEEAQTDKSEAIKKRSRAKATPRKIPQQSTDAPPESPYIDIVSVDVDDDETDIDDENLDLNDDGKPKKKKRLGRRKKKGTADGGDPNKPKKRKSKTIYQCKVCNKMYVGKKSWQIHLRLHTGEKPFKCEICDKAFTCQYKLARHKVVHNNDDALKFTCTTCGKKISRRDHFKRHVKLHEEGNKTVFVCDYCGKQYMTNFAYRIHIGHHQVDKGVLSCIICAQEFPDKDQILAHLKIHSQGRLPKRDRGPRLCSLCGKSFSGMHHLQRHMKTHGAKTMMCQFCAQTFGRKDHLERHQHAKHSAELAMVGIIVPTKEKKKNPQKIQSTRNNATAAVSQLPKEAIVASNTYRNDFDVNIEATRIMHQSDRTQSPHLHPQHPSTISQQRSPHDALSIVNMSRLPNSAMDLSQLSQQQTSYSSAPQIVNSNYAPLMTSSHSSNDVSESMRNLQFHYADVMTPRSSNHGDGQALAYQNAIQVSNLSKFQPSQRHCIPGVAGVVPGVINTVGLSCDVENEGIVRFARVAPDSRTQDNNMSTIHSLHFDRSLFP